MSEHPNTADVDQRSAFAYMRRNAILGIGALLHSRIVLGNQKILQAAQRNPDGFLGMPEPDRQEAEKPPPLYG